MESKEALKSPGKSNPRIAGGWPGRSITAEGYYLNKARHFC